jgi:hypothetical protein
MAFQKWGKGGFNYHARISDMDFDGVESAFLNSGLGVFTGAVQHPTPVE